METNFNPAGDIMCELYLEGGGRVGEKEGTPGGGWVGGGGEGDGGAGLQL